TQRQRGKFGRQTFAAPVAEALELGHVQYKRGISQVKCNTRQGNKQQYPCTQYGKLSAGSDLTLVRPIGNDQCASNGERKRSDHPVERVAQKGGDSQPAVGNEHTRQRIECIPRPGRIVSDQGIPEKQLQQQGNVAYYFDIRSGNAADQPVC